MSGPDARPEPGVGALRVVVVGADGEAVGRVVRERRGAGDRVAGFVGHDAATARQMAEEMLGGVDEVLEVASPPGPGRGEGDS